jgi:AcrR family transcriptional regulator
MQAMHVSSEIGHRERKKLQTRNNIERAAVQIVLEQGYEAATAEAIARRADISLRTFFNYFPSKDLAIIGPGIHMVDEQQAMRILEEEGAHLLKGICRVTETCVAAVSPASDLMQDRRHLMQKEPRLLHAHLIALMEFEVELTRLVTGHLRAHPERRRLVRLASVEEEASIAVVMVDSAVRFSVERWLERWSANGDDLSLSARDIERTIDMMAEIHRRSI